MLSIFYKELSSRLFTTDSFNQALFNQLPTWRSIVLMGLLLRTVESSQALLPGCFETAFNNNIKLSVSSLFVKSLNPSFDPSLNSCPFKLDGIGISVQKTVPSIKTGWIACSKFLPIILPIKTTYNSPKIQDKTSFGEL